MGKKNPKEFFEIANKLVEIHAVIRHTCLKVEDLGSFVNKLHGEVCTVVKSVECKRDGKEVAKTSELGVFGVTQEKQEAALELKKPSEVELPGIARV